jgi:hypothetical protein
MLRSLPLSLYIMLLKSDLEVQPPAYTPLPERESEKDLLSPSSVSSESSVTASTTTSSRSDRAMRIEFNLKLLNNDGSPMSLLTSYKLFSLYRFTTLALSLGLSIALIPLAAVFIDQYWYHVGRLRYALGLAITTLLITFVA